ncbi:MAG: hypothetical protein HY323_07250 [Betaproteobacteria bacterium]|nr:hypothetical protein [Betaproteobacteria bacterium]
MRTILSALALLALLLALARPAAAWSPDPWTAEQVALQGAFLGLLAIDAAQTMDFRGARVGELNPLLGSHPTDTGIARYFIATALLHGAVSAVLPSSLRTRWQYVTAGVQAHSVWVNWQLGLTFGF